MWCGLCVKQGAINCHRKGKKKLRHLTKPMSPQCVQFVIDTKKIPAKLLRLAMSLGHLPKSHLRLLITLIDQSIKLRAQELNLGLSLDYTLDVFKTNELSNHKVHLISSPKHEEAAYGVIFLEEPKNAVVSITLDKALFIRERDRKLKNLWPKIQAIFLLLKEDRRRKKLTYIFKKLGKPYIDKMLNLNGINIRAKSRKLEDTIDIILRTYL